MRKFVFTFLPASLLLVCLAMVLSTCGGGSGGGDGGGGSTATLTGLSVNGPSLMSEYSTATYTATASWSDNSTSTVTPTWSVNPPVAEISTGGVFSCRGGVASDQAVTVSATYSSGGITKTGTKDVTITNIIAIPFTAPMLSGKIFYGEGFSGGGASDSSLLYFNADLTFREDYTYSGHLTGTWSIDSSGRLVVPVTSLGSVAVTLLSDSLTEMQVSVVDGTGTPSTATLEKTVPVDNSILPGTYVNDSGDTWIFISNGTGSTTGGGGWTFTWSVNSGILKVVFSNGYQGWMYARASSQSSPTSYAILKWAFVEYTPTGGFYYYYGGMVLTRQ